MSFRAVSRGSPMSSRNRSRIRRFKRETLIHPPLVWLTPSFYDTPFRSLGPEPWFSWRGNRSARLMTSLEKSRYHGTYSHAKAVSIGNEAMPLRRNDNSKRIQLVKRSGGRISSTSSIHLNPASNDSSPHTFVSRLSFVHFTNQLAPCWAFSLPSPCSALSLNPSNG